MAEFDVDQGDVAEEMAELKRRTGKDITILGSGKRHFEEGSDQEELEVLDSKMFSIGVL